ncbi:hypothetical protein [Chromobacterium haemolyticum]|uniref:hypothetical protein n=1 Tax=Chromobacterium haemolyticum TaxID=394935 RepID=UPI001317855F|nr:hypothetical protein [Chromobacterium haemolyticum]BBH11772.1 hypothetical protein CH06BL_10200 [Chromobacterium haemolyticum]
MNYPPLRSKPRVVPALAQLFVVPKLTIKSVVLTYSRTTVIEKVGKLPSSIFTAKEAMHLLCMSLDSARKICQDGLKLGLLVVAKRDGKLIFYRKTTRSLDLEWR